MSGLGLALVTNSGDGTVTTFRVGDSRLKRLAVSEVGQGCSTLAVDAKRRLVYVGAKPSSILTCSLDIVSGELAVVEETSVPGSPTYLTLTPGGERLLGAFYHEGYGMCWPVDNGHLGEPTGVVSHANLHSVVVTLDTRHAYFVSLGEDCVIRYELSPDGSLARGLVARAPTGSGPRHIVLNSAQTAAFVVTEFSGQLLQYLRDQTTGELTLTTKHSIVDPSAALKHSRYGADPRAEHLIWGADIHLSPNGRFAWASERSASTIASLLRNQSGELEPVTTFTPTEPQPRGFGVSPDGRFLLAVGERSKTATLYEVVADAKLVAVDRQETGSKANWVRFV